jgi:hypothetical protein
MKRSIFTAICLLICTAFVMSAFSEQKGKGCPMMKGKGMGNFEAQDANKDGKLSKEEWTTFHNKMFEDADANKDGSIDNKEMEEYHKKMMEENHKMMKGK